MSRSKKKYNFYYGVPHAHTSLSDGAAPPYEAYKYARDMNIDFLICTDHVGYLLGKNSKSNNKEYRTKWEQLQGEAKEINKRYKDFVALTGYELSTNFWGHMNIITNRHLIDKKRKNSNEFFEWIVDKNDIILSLNHPYQHKNRLSYSTEFDKYINLYEVGHGIPTTKYVRSFNEYYNTLDLGWHIGAINGQDNHDLSWGKSENLTVVIAEELKPRAILKAMRERRVYSTESKTLKMVLKANGSWMGSIIRVENNIIDFEIVAQDKKYPITQIELISNGGKIVFKKDFNNLDTIRLNITLKQTPKDFWYVLKVTQVDNKIGISSPIFLK